MKKRFKRLTAVIAVILIIPVFAINSLAAELVSGARWCHMSSIYNGTEYVNSCILVFDIDDMDGYWDNSYGDSTIVETGIDIWNDFSEDRIKTAVSPSVANVKMVTYNGTVEGWEILYDGTALTAIYDKEDDQYSDGDLTGDCNMSDFGNRINRALVLFHPKYLPDGTDAEKRKLDLIKIVVHEIGHCVNLGHPSTTYEMEIPSVMQEESHIIERLWTNGGYPNPQSYDLDNLEQMYYTIFT